MCTIIHVLWVGIGRLWTPKHPLGQTVVTVSDRALQLSL